MRASLILILVIFLAAACGQPTTDAASATSPPSPPSDPSAPAAAAPADAVLTGCQVDADCVIVEMGCCDHCNGGWVLSVNKSHRTAAEQRWRETGCGGGCTERGCPHTPAPFCNAGTCSRREQRFSAGSDEAQLVEVPNAPR